MRNGPKCNSNIDLGVYLTKFHIFGESIYFRDLTEKRTKHTPKIRIQNDLAPTKEYSRRHQKAPTRRWDPPGRGGAWPSPGPTCQGSPSRIFPPRTFRLHLDH